MTDNNTPRTSLRKSLREQRRAIDTETQTNHAFCLASQISSCDVYKRSKRIAAYLAEDGEIDPFFIIQHAWQSNKKIYLPVLAPFAPRLYFAPYTPDTKLKPNRFQIDEPDVHPRYWLKAHQLDLILMPLVGFDKTGNRLGMGGGFYDRSLNFTRYRKTAYRPGLIGLAHQQQCVKKLQPQPHDIAMQLIITESEIIKPV